MIEQVQAELITDALSRNGYAILPRAIPSLISDPLYARIRGIDDSRLKLASVGRGRRNKLDVSIRSDKICWMNPSNPSEKSYLTWMEDLRLALNERLFLGLFDYEAHFSFYQQGAFYRRHLDAFEGETNRLLSTVCYLNPQWQEEDGGQLLLYPQGDNRPMVKILPQFATLVVFLSREIVHEVLPANRPRYSIAGWFRANSSLTFIANPMK